MKKLKRAIAATLNYRFVFINVQRLHPTMIRFPDRFQSASWWGSSIDRYP